MSQSTVRLWMGLCCAALALYVPNLVTVPYFMHLIILALVWVILAQGQNLMQGLVGYVSITQAGFMGVGAYFSTLLTLKLGCDCDLGLQHGDFHDFVDL